jgi:hypothetical protein
MSLRHLRPPPLAPDGADDRNALLLPSPRSSRNLASALKEATNRMRPVAGAVYFLRLPAIYETLCQDGLSQTW